MGAEQGRHDYEKESNSVRGIILTNMMLAAAPRQL
jgi:hypothetical protein